MHSLARRSAAVAAIAALMVSFSAAPALAHFCFKTGWKGASAQNAAGSNAWLTADEWKGFVAEVPDEEVCPAAKQYLVDFLDQQAPNTLFMGPGLLAGGTLHNGKGKTPAHFSYMPFEDAFALCGAPPA